MARMETELQWMESLLASKTSFLGWREYLEDKADRLAAWDPDEYSQLPMQFAALAKRLESKHWPPQPQKRGTRS